MIIWLLCLDAEIVTLKHVAKFGQKSPSGLLMKKPQSQCKNINMV